MNNELFESNVLNDMAEFVYKAAKDAGWHESNDIDARIGNFVANLHSETSELWEAYRNGTLNFPCDKSDLMTKHLGETLTCKEEELADIVIRALDTAKFLNVDISKAVRIKLAFNKTRSKRHGGKLA